MTSAGLQTGHGEVYGTWSTQLGYSECCAQPATEPEGEGVEDHVLDVMGMLKVPRVTGQTARVSGLEIRDS